MSIQLYYWSVPFRAEPIRMLLTYVQAEFSQADSEAVLAVKNDEIARQTILGMAPPYLLDSATGVKLAQMPAIMLYLAEKYQLLPQGEFAAARMQRVLGDVTDILTDITRNNGHQLWDNDAWREFLDTRLPRWAQICERHLTELGTATESDGQRPNAVDFAIWAVWGNFYEHFPALNPWFEQFAPGIVGHHRLLPSCPHLQDWWEQTRERYGDIYCGGQIEASLREMMRNTG
jgi:glutathione S-transferase